MTNVRVLSLSLCSASTGDALRETRVPACKHTIGQPRRRSIEFTPARFCPRKTRLYVCRTEREKSRDRKKKRERGERESASEIKNRRAKVYFQGGAWRNATLSRSTSQTRPRRASTINQASDGAPAFLAAHMGACVRSLDLPCRPADCTREPLYLPRIFDGPTLDDSALPSVVPRRR